MQAQPMSAYKRLAWLLLLIVIGVYALHLWYSGKLKDDLIAQKTLVAAHTQTLKQDEDKLALATRTEQTLRGEIQALTGRIDTAAQAHQALEGDLATLKRQHAETMAAERTKATDALAAAKAEAAATLSAAQDEAANTLAAEKQKAAQALAELQGLYDTATKAAAAMGAEILQLKQSQVDTAANHEAQLATLMQEHRANVKAVEDRLNGRIAALQTTLEGTDPERAALFASFDERLQANQKSIADLDAAKVDLTNQLNTANQTIEAKSQALATAKEQMQATQAELTQTRGELSQLQAQHDAAMEKATLDQAALQAKHEAAVEKAAAERAIMADQHAAAMDQAAKQQADLKAQHAAAMDAAAKQQADLKAQHAAAMDAAAKAQADLKAAHAAALNKAAQETAAIKAALEGELAQAKAAHADAISQAQGRIETLTANLSAETASLAALQTKHDTLVADLNSKLSATEQTLNGVRTDLDAAEKSAAEQKAALEQQIAAAKDRIATLEGTLAGERTQAGAALAAAKQAHVDAMERQHKLLVEVSALGGKETERGLLLTLAETDLRFPVSKATLPSGDLPSLDRMAALMTQFPRLTARIEGHTDASGREETNLALSQERADAVKQALVERGIAPERMEAVGIGESRPIADNATKAGSRQNRRVEVYVIEAAQ